VSLKASLKSGLRDVPHFSVDSKDLRDREVDKKIEVRFETISVHSAIEKAATKDSTEDHRRWLSMALLWAD